MRTLQLFVFAALTLSTAACARHQVEAPAAASASMHQPTAEEMTAAMQKASTLTAEHAFLKGFEGKWKVTTKMWMEPGAAPQISTGKSSASMVLGGKFLKEDFSGTFMKQPFNGVGYTGFDTIAGEFVSVWMDTISTSMMSTRGSMNAAKDSIEFGGEMSCPMTPSGKMRVRSVLHRIDGEHHTFEMFNVGPDGKEFKGMEIAYVRSK